MPPFRDKTETFDTITPSSLLILKYKLGALCQSLKSILSRRISFQAKNYQWCPDSYILYSLFEPLSLSIQAPIVSIKAIVVFFSTTGIWPWHKTLSFLIYSWAPLRLWFVQQAYDTKISTLLSTQRLPSDTIQKTCQLQSFVCTVLPITNN